MNQFSTFMVHGCRVRALSLSLIHFVRCKWLPAQIFPAHIHCLCDAKRERSKKNQRFSIIAHVVAKDPPSEKFVVGEFMILAKNFALKSH